MRSRLLLFTTILLFSCKDSKTIDEAVISADRAQYKQAAFANGQLPLSVTIEEAPEQIIEGNLFGEFYCDRVMFFINDNIADKLFNSTIDKITLYYIDGVLSKSKYILNEDISSSLINDLGKLKILGFDYKNRDLIETKDILIKKDGKYSLSKELDNYRLKWTINGQEVIFRVNQDNETEKFAYIKQIEDYEEQLSAIERQCR